MKNILQSTGRKYADENRQQEMERRAHSFQEAGVWFFQLSCFSNVAADLCKQVAVSSSSYECPVAFGCSLPKGGHVVNAAGLESRTGLVK